ncbi:MULTISPECIES: hypothetical protein [Streptomyces]|uniref:hypothetical protein n=1 Tax=Streptomyces TaxID=1883 RepID=UPI000F6E95BE|nr:hypothetical protein [Streptomyces sp. W1SF4]AZM91161.1 hypothetical protein D1J60_24055 [Streptomyces sp. W1SF4]
MEHLPSVNVLTLRADRPHPQAVFYSVGIRPFIDGWDVLEEIHPGGDASCRQGMWFGPPETWPLWAAEEPARVELSNNDCVTDCCGGVFVTIRRQGDRVVWSGWENTDDIRVPLPAEAEFDAVQYDAELARVVADHSWEEPVDAAARLLAQGITDSGWYERWNCLPLRQGINVSGRGESSCVSMYFLTGPDSGSRGYTMQVSAHEPVQDQVRRFVEEITATDPRKTAQGH